MIQEDDVFSIQKVTYMSKFVRARIVVVENDSAVGFPYFFEDYWQANSCEPFKIDHSTFL